MKRTLIAASLVFCSGALYANECSVNIEGKMTLEDKVLTVTTEESDVISIEPNYQLFVNGNELGLSPIEKQWVQDYYDGIYGAVPQAANIAVEGVALASSAITEVFGGLLGQDNQAIERVTEKLTDIGDKVHASFYAEDGSIRVDSMHFEDGDMFGEQWSNEFEEAIEEVISNSIGQLLVAIGTQMMFGDGDSEDFDQRMETFSNDFEGKIEAQAAVIEEQAEALCSQVANIDHAENKLQSNISELADLNVFSVETEKRRM
jgi:hypothetical protein